MYKKYDLLKKLSEWRQSGKLEKFGLCPCLEYTKYSSTLSLFEPSSEEYEELREKDMSTWWWASGLKQNNMHKVRKFTEMRETIVLFILAIHGEL